MQACGLKHLLPVHPQTLYQVTPHAGVWIETNGTMLVGLSAGVTPHAGVWIETCVVNDNILYLIGHASCRRVD